MTWRKESLKEALAILAADPAKQLEHLRGLGLPGAIDELALDYDAVAAAADYMLLSKELGENQSVAVKELNERLLRMSGHANADLWTPDALSSAPEWKEVRSRAEECLQLLTVDGIVR